MIAFLRGTVADLTEGSVVLDVNGVGYEVLVPGQLIDMLEGVGQELKLYTYMQVREDAVALFGFLTRDDLQMYKMLIGVGGVGPKAGLSILSALGADDLRFAILADDARKISKAPGTQATWMSSPRTPRRSRPSSQPERSLETMNSLNRAHTIPKRRPFAFRSPSKTLPGVLFIFLLSCFI